MADKKKILVVDDNEPFIELAFEGLGKALTCLPDLILLDINMPRITGIEFVRKLSVNPQTA